MNQQQAAQEQAAKVQGNIHQHGLQAQGNPAAVAKNQAQQHPKVEQLLEQGRAQIAAALPAFIKTDRFIRVALTEVRNNPDLQKCDPVSICTAIMKSAQLGLDIGGALGQAYLVPFKNRDTGQLEAQLIPGYRGLVQLVRRSGQVSTFYAMCVYEGDQFTYTLGTDPKIEHVPGDSSNKLTHVYAVCVFKDGGHQFEVMTKKQVEDHRNKYSSQPNGRGWKNSFDEMAKKTVVRKIIKMLPISIEMPETDLDEQDREPMAAEPAKWQALQARSDIVPEEERGAYLKMIDELLEKAGEKKIAIQVPQDYHSFPVDQLVAMVAYLKENVGG